MKLVLELNSEQENFLSELVREGIAESIEAAAIHIIDNYPVPYSGPVGDDFEQSNHKQQW